MCLGLFLRQGVHLYADELLVCCNYKSLSHFLPDFVYSQIRNAPAITKQIEKNINRYIALFFVIGQKMAS